MRDGLSTTSEGLPDDLRPAFDASVQQGEWIGALRLLLTEAERRTDVRERVACYLRAAALYEQQFANSAEAQGILEYVLGLSPDEPAAILKLRELYTRARRRDKLRLLAEDPRKLAGHAPVPRPPASHSPTAAAGRLPARLVAAGLFIALPATVVAANIRAHAMVEPHDNAGGVLGWLIFVGLDLVFCIVFVACAWLPARWALRRVGGSALLMMLALLSATFLIALVPTLGWSATDATNVLLDPNAPSLVKVRVVDHVRWGKSGRFSAIRAQSARSGSTVILRCLRLQPVGSEHVLRRGEGFFRRPYYLPAQ